MSARYGWIDFEEDESTDAVPGKYVLTIGRLNDSEHVVDEMAVIIHRVTPTHPLDGPLMQSKRRDAQRIVDALNFTRSMR